MRKTILTCFLLTAVFVAGFSQETATSSKVPRLNKTGIGQSGCAAYLPAEMPEFTLAKSEDGSDVYTSEAIVDSFAFGCITVRFAETFANASAEELEELLISYLEFLKSLFEITGATGYGKGHTQESTPDARGVIDYWEDGAGRQYVVKGWINPQCIGILYIGGAGEYPHFNLQQMYLDGFRFGE